MAKFEYRYQDITFDNCWKTWKFEKDNNVFVSFTTDLLPYKEMLSNGIVDATINYTLEFLKKLRHKKSYIRLFYSGGYDSHKILQTAVDNDIYIDEIVTFTRNLYNKPNLQKCDTEIFNEAIPNLNKINSNSVGKVVFKNYDAEFMRNLYADKNWIFNLPGGDFAFRIAQPFGYHNDIISDCQIFGKDKPYLLHYKNKWFATILDTTLADSFNVNNSCFFFIEPEMIKEFILESRKLRTYVLSNLNEKNSNYIFKIYSPYTKFNNEHYATTSELGKYDGNFFNNKDKLALQESIDCNDLDLILKWASGVNELVSEFPSLIHENTLIKWPPSKFPWFVDIDTLEIFSQQELIPNGFL